MSNANAVFSAFAFEQVHGSEATQYDELIAHNKATLLAALAAAGVRECVVSYEGFGDSGNVVNVQLTSDDGAPMSALGNIDLAVQDSRYVDGAWTTSVRSQTMPFSDAFSYFTHVALYRHHPGFENNDGGSGEVYFEVDSTRVWIEHRDYYTESIYSENEL